MLVSLHPHEDGVGHGLPFIAEEVGGYRSVGHVSEEDELKKLLGQLLAPFKHCSFDLCPQTADGPATLIERLGPCDRKALSEGLEVLQALSIIEAAWKPKVNRDLDLLLFPKARFLLVVIPRETDSMAWAHLIVEKQVQGPKDVGPTA